MSDDCSHLCTPVFPVKRRDSKGVVGLAGSVMTPWTPATNMLLLSCFSDKFFMTLVVTIDRVDPLSSKALTTMVLPEGPVTKT